jgi:beta-N-acetylhexosaminidase
MKKTLAKYQVGGVILFSRNIAKRKQTAKLTAKLLAGARTPLFISVDEEGGRVSRIASNEKMKTTSFPSAEEIGETQDDEYTYEMAKTIGTEIRELGFNVDFAPVADVKTSELNEEIGDRSFGSDPELVAEYVSAFVQGLHKANVGTALKHFPGQGSSSGDTHKESVDIDSSIARLRKTDFVPFKAGIASDADFVMVSHISVSKVTESAVPASMSDLMMQTILRDELGFKKVIITDAFDMASITDNYTSAEAAYQAFKAGADIILMPQNFKEAYKEILSKVEDGTIAQERLDDSVLRILAVKIQRGIL